MGEPESGLRRLAAFSLLLNLTVGFLLLQAYSVAQDFALGVVLDPWLALFPLVWVDLALVVFLFLAHGFLLRSRHTAPAGGWRSWLVPDFRSLAGALRPGPLRPWIVASSAIYLIVLLFLQGVLVVDPSAAILPEGTEYPYADAFGGPLGWGPKLVWAPNPYFGVLLRPYTVAAAALLGVLGGMGLGIAAYGWRRDRDRGVRNLAGTLSGAMVVCPACAASPVSAFLFSSFTASAAGGAAGSALGSFLALTTVLLIASVIAMWIGLARLSRRLVLPEAPPRSREERIRRLGDFALLLAILLAAGTLLVDLAQAPGGGHTHDGADAEPAGHATSTLLLAFAAVVIAGQGAAARLSGPGHSKRSAALVAALTLLFADGVVHWLAVSEHVGSAPDVGFFLVVGFAQVVGVPVALRSRKVLWWLGVPLTAFLLGLYVATRLVAPPFETEPEPFEVLGLVSKGLEVSILVAFGLFFGRGIVPRFRAEGGAPDLPTFFLVVSLGASGITVLGEVAWSVLPIGVGLAFGLAWSAGAVFAARRRREFAWAVVAGLLAGHLGYAAYYASVPLLWPLALCLGTSSVSLAGLTLALREWRASARVPSVD